MEDNAIRAGPAINFTTMASTAIRVPQAIILARDAMKRPVKWQIASSWVIIGF